MTKSILKSLVILGLILVTCTVCLYAQKTDFKLDKASFQTGESISIIFLAPMKSPESDQAWVTIVPADSPDSEYADYV